MEFLKSKEQVLADKFGTVHEAVFKMGDVFKVKTTVEIPKSLINGFVSKAKKEHNMDPRENWSDTDLAEMFVSYITANFVNIESLPVQAILGEKASGAQGEVQTDINPGEVSAVTELQPEAQPIQTEIQPVQTNPGEPTAEIQNQQ